MKRPTDSDISGTKLAAIIGRSKRTAIPNGIYTTAASQQVTSPLQHHVRGDAHTLGSFSNSPAGSTSLRAQEPERVTLTRLTGSQQKTC